MPAMLSIADMIKQVKGVSSHFVNQTLRPEAELKWQGGYAAFTVSRWDLPKVIGYVQRQKEHHSAGDLWEEMEETHEPATPPT